MEALPSDDRRQLAAFLVALRHQDLAGYRLLMTGKIDDRSPEKWVTLEKTRPAAEILRMDYRLLISMEVVEFLERLPLRPHQPFRNIIEAIGNGPSGSIHAADR